MERHEVRIATLIVFLAIGFAVAPAAVAIGILINVPPPPIHFTPPPMDLATIAPWISVPLSMLALFKTDKEA